MPAYVFDHMHLYRPDPVKTADFYQKIFGAKIISKGEIGNGRVVVNLDLNGITLLINTPANDSVKMGLAHFGLRTDNLDDAVKELKAKGVPFTQEITDIRPGFRISFFTAPEGMTVELQEGG